MYNAAQHRRGQYRLAIGTCCTSASPRRGQHGLAIGSSPPHRSQLSMKTTLGNRARTLHADLQIDRLCPLRLRHCHLDLPATWLRPCWPTPRAPWPSSAPFPSSWPCEEDPMKSKSALGLSPPLVCRSSARPWCSVVPSRRFGVMPASDRAAGTRDGGRADRRNQEQAREGFP